MEREEIVLDASVVIKWFTQEEGRDKAIILRDKFIQGEMELICPDLVLYELANALRYNPKFRKDDVEQAIDSLSEIELTIVLPLIPMLQNAINFSFIKNLTMYDAIYLALASDLGCKLITADKKFYDKVKDLGFIFLLSEVREDF